MSTGIVRQLIRERQQELVDLAAALIRIPTENPGPEFIERSNEAASYIGDYLAKKGIRVNNYRRESGGLITLVGDAPLTGAPGPRLLFCGHTDVVPAGDRARWSFDPFSGEIRAGMLLGRGATDMKGGLAALLFVAGLLQELAPMLNLNGSLGVITSPDEEIAGDEVAWVLDKGLIQGDACLIGEPNPPRHPRVGNKGLAWMMLTIPGQPGHGAYQPISGGVSAIRLGAKAVEVLGRLWELRSTPPAELSQLLYQSEWYWTRQSKNPLQAELLFRPSYNPGVIRGGTKVNVVAENCMIEVDSRVPYGMKPEVVLGAARSLVEAVAPGAVVEPLISLDNPNWTLETRPIVLTLERAIKLILGEREPIFSILGLTANDASHFRRHGIDTVLYGPGLLHTIHAYDERVPVADLIQSAEIYAETAIEYLRSF